MADRRKASRWPLKRAQSAAVRAREYLFSLSRRPEMPMLLMNSIILGCLKDTKSPESWRGGAMLYNI
jgi:hypothetical protein